MGFYFLKKENPESEWNTHDVKVERGHWWWKVSGGRRKRAERETDKKPRLNEDTTRKPSTLHANNTKIILKS